MLGIGAVSRDRVCTKAGVLLLNSHCTTALMLALLSLITFRCGDDTTGNNTGVTDTTSVPDTNLVFGNDSLGGVPDVVFIQDDVVFIQDDVVSALCTDDSDCATDNPCVVAVCGAKGQCITTPLVGKTCDDNNVCTDGDQCTESGECGPGTLVTIPKEPCATCACDPKSGVRCIPLAPGTACDDFDCCTTSDRCAACVTGDPGCSSRGLVCLGKLAACDDANSCTLDSCTCSDQATQPECTYVAVPDRTVCVENPSLCTQGDQCVGGKCIAGAPAMLSDGNPCTQDVCVKGVIDHLPLQDGQCDDGDECTTGDHCFLGACVGGPPVVCDVPLCAGSVECIPGQGCVPSWLPTGAVCSGDDTCGAGFACNADHLCLPTVGKSCDDNNLCTTDSCDPETGACIHDYIANTCSNVGPCISPQCNPQTGLCDIPLANGTPCPEGTCQSGVCQCVPNCQGQVCGDDGCGGSCGQCSAGLTCDNGECVGCEKSCPTVCLPSGVCCPPTGFCPTSNTTLSGKHTFDLVYIPPGVTVTCVGDDPLELTISGDVIVEGALRADGMPGTSGSGDDNVGVCGGFRGGDGFRSCTSSATTFCETSAASVQECNAWLSPKETFSGGVCTYLSNAPGQPGDGPGGGWGGQMAHPIHNGAPGSAGGGGGGSYVTSGTTGIAGTTICGTKPSGGNSGPTVAPGTIPKGGSGGGAGGMTRAGACDLACPLGCTAWGGDGGAGGGVIVLNVSGQLHIPGVVSTRGGDGGTSGGATCGGSGGGGSGGVIKVNAKEIVTPGPQAAHLVVTGGTGGNPKCPGIGTGGNGGTGALLISKP